MRLRIPGVGDVPIAVRADAAPGACAAFAAAAARGAPCSLHRGEPEPAAGSAGPPYALCQFTVDDAALKQLPHEGTAAITRGAVCHIVGTTDVFVSLARRGEHAGWEASMTVFGTVAEDDLARVFEQKILREPLKTVTHPTYGTVMSMLVTPRPCTLAPS